jgi:hypothetical protein
LLGKVSWSGRDGCDDVVPVRALRAGRHEVNEDHFLHACGQANATFLPKGRRFALINAMFGPLLQRRHQFGPSS